MTSNNRKNRGGAGGRGPSGTSSPRPNPTPTPSPMSPPPTSPQPNFGHGRNHSKDPIMSPSASSSATARSSPIPGAERDMGERRTVGSFNGTVPKYIYDFSKALSGEVRILLAEVGQLREERRRLQVEIAEIMALKSKHTQDGTSGDYAMGMIPGGLGMPYDHPDHLAYAMAGLSLPAPPGAFPSEPDPNLALAPIEPEAPQPAPPAWRTVHRRAERKPRAKKPSQPQTIPTPAQVPPLEVPRANIPAWSQWRPNPLLSPTPQHGSGPYGAYPGASATPPPRSGLFGPPSPPPK